MNIKPLLLMTWLTVYVVSLCLLITYAGLGFPDLSPMILGIGGSNVLAVWLLVIYGKDRS